MGHLRGSGRLALSGHLRRYARRARSRGWSGGFPGCAGRRRRAWAHPLKHSRKLARFARRSGRWNRRGNRRARAARRTSRSGWRYRTSRNGRPRRRTALKHPGELPRAAFQRGEFRRRRRDRRPRRNRWPNGWRGRIDRWCGRGRHALRHADRRRRSPRPPFRRGLRFGRRSSHLVGQSFRPVHRHLPAEGNRLGVL